MVKHEIDEKFVVENINPIVGFIFHSAKQLGRDNAPDSMDRKYLHKGTEKIKELLENYVALVEEHEDRMLE